MAGGVPAASANIHRIAGRAARGKGMPQNDRRPPNALSAERGAHHQPRREMEWLGAGGERALTNKSAAGGRAV